MKRHIFVPRTILAYGQDFTNLESRKYLDLSPLSPAANGEYCVPNDCDLLITHDGEDGQISQCIHSLSSNVPVVVHLHLQWSYLHEEQQRHLTASLQRARTAVVPAQFLARRTTAFIPTVDCRVVYNGVDSDRFRLSVHEERKAYRDSLGLASYARLLVFVGRLEKPKGTQLLKEIAKQLPRGSYLLIQYPGYVPQRTLDAYRSRAEQIRTMNPDRVFIIEDNDRQGDRIVRYADIAVHPSLSEVAPKVVLEALMSGVPVVATACTPFYDELHGIGARSEWLSVVPLPAYVQEQMGRRNLALERVTEIDKSVQS